MSKQGFVMAFTSWDELKKQLLDDLASGVWRTTSSYSVTSGGGSRTFTYRTFDEFKKILDFVTEQATLESRTPGYYGRTRAGNGGRA